MIQTLPAVPTSLGDFFQITWKNHIHKDIFQKKNYYKINHNQTLI